MAREYAWIAAARSPAFCSATPNPRSHPCPGCRGGRGTDPADRLRGRTTSTSPPGRSTTPVRAGSPASPIALGNTVVVQRKFDAEDWLRLVQTYRVTTTFTAPTPIRMVCTPARGGQGALRPLQHARLIANAAPWTLALKKMYLADFPPDSLWEVYGSTELGVDTVLRAGGPPAQARVVRSAGARRRDQAVRRRTGDEVTEPFQTGELYVGSAGMFDTYYKAEDKYEESSRGDYHTVGDIAYRDEDGYYYIADRKNDMIISGGMNIYPAEVEAALDASPDVYEVAVFGIPNEQWGESVHAVVVPSRPGVTEAGHPGLRPGAPGRLQDPQVRQLCGGAAQDRLGQGAQAPAAGVASARADVARPSRVRPDGPYLVLR